MAKKIQGLHAYRCKTNAEEQAFADAWAVQCSQGKTLSYLLTVGDQHQLVIPAERDQVVAATVIQWLGSHVGECFLRDMGYVKGKI